MVPGLMATRPYQRHGLHALKRRLAVRGLDGIDKRSGAGRALAEWRRELVADLGGADALSAQQRAVIDTASQKRLLIDSVGAWLLDHPKLVNGRRRALYPVVLQWAQLADSLGRDLALLGLERRKAPGPTLQEYLAARYPTREGTEPGP
jgi:hypothetical protein